MSPKVWAGGLIGACDDIRPGKEAAALNAGMRLVLVGVDSVRIAYSFHELREQASRMAQTSFTSEHEQGGLGIELLLQQYEQFETYDAWDS